MYEISDFINRKRKLSTAILKTPNGRFTLIGSVPVELCHPTKNSLTPGSMSSNVYCNEQEAIDALLALNITHFQLSDCSYYDK